MCAWQPLSASLCLALSHILPRCVLARVCTVRCSLKHECAKARTKGWGDPEGPDLMYSVWVSVGRGRGGIIRPGGREGRREGGREWCTAAIARMRSETRVMRNLTSAVCRSPTQHPSSCRHALNSVKIAGGEPPPHHRLTGETPKWGNGESILPRSPIVSQSLCFPSLLTPWLNVFFSNILAFCHQYLSPSLLLPPPNLV